MLKLVSVCLWLPGDLLLNHVIPFVYSIMLYPQVFLLLAALLAVVLAGPAPGPLPNPAPVPQFVYSAGYPAVGYASPYVYYG